MQPLKIVKKTLLLGEQTVYDFSVNPDRHYILENGIVSHNSYIPTKEMGGGSGAKYAASSVVFLGKKRMKDEDKNVVGNIITCTMWKSRFTREYSRGEVGLSFENGLDRYYGLFDFCVENSVIQRDKNTYTMPDGVEASKSEIEENPAKYFTPEVLKVVDVAIGNAFSFGGPLEIEEEQPELLVEGE